MDRVLPNAKELQHSWSLHRECRHNAVLYHTANKYAREQDLEWGSTAGPRLENTTPNAHSLDNCISLQRPPCTCLAPAPLNPLMDPVSPIPERHKDNLYMHLVQRRNFIRPRKIARHHDSTIPASDAMAKRQLRCKISTA